MNKWKKDLKTKSRCSSGGVAKKKGGRKGEKRDHWKDSKDFEFGNIWEERITSLNQEEKGAGLPKILSKA